ncbi:MAG TPA: DUF4412 domain-containing protein [Opitutaceae bacterium]|nr:DUF4412 domain-containing protein [Opitutaceae bacterium]
MKTFVSLLAGLLLAPAVISAAEFEGKVTFKMTSGKDKAQDIRYAIKNGKFRIELPGQAGMGGLIVDPVKRESVVLMDQQKMYMVMAIPDAKATDAKAGKGDGATLEKTGETEKILGYTAEKYISKTADATTELWLAEGLGTFVGFGNSNPMGGRRGGSAPATQAWERALAGKEMFPLRVVSRDHANKETFKLEATSIDKTGLPDAMFTPPADYQKFDMGGMMKGMMPGNR